MSIIKIKISCSESYDFTNRKSNCNFQILDIICEDNIEYYSIPISSHFYKAINKINEEVLDYNDKNNPYKNIPTWIGDLRTANIYHTLFKNIGSKSNIYAFRTIKELKLINLLSKNNIFKLYKLILKDISNIWISIINDNNDLDNKYNNLSKFINYKFTIESALGFNVTFEEQLQLLKATKTYEGKYENNVRFEIKDNLHSELKEDFNRVSLFKIDYILVKILQHYLPDYDGYCSYRTKSLVHNEFHEEICIFNPEECIKRAKNNYCDASYYNNFAKNYSYLSNNKPEFVHIQSGGLNTLINKEKELLDLQFEEIKKINEKLEDENNEETKYQEIINKEKTQLCLEFGNNDLKKINIEYINFFIISYNEINNQHITLFEHNNIYLLLQKYRFFNNYILKNINNIKELKELIKLKELIELKDSLIKKIQKKLLPEY
jgi:hypothetical protein